MMECISYMENEDIPENIKIFVETDKVDNYILIGCESDKLYENDKRFNFISIKFMNKGI